MSDTKDTPMPIPLLAAALRADMQTLTLAYGNHLQPVMEHVVSIQAVAMRRRQQSCPVVVRMMDVSSKITYIHTSVQEVNTADRRVCLTRDVQTSLSLSMATTVSKVTAIGLELLVKQPVIF